MILSEALDLVALPYSQYDNILQAVDNGPPSTATLTDKETLDPARKTVDQEQGDDQDETIIWKLI